MRRLGNNMPSDKKPGRIRAGEKLIRVAHEISAWGGGRDNRCRHLPPVQFPAGRRDLVIENVMTQDFVSRFYEDDDLTQTEFDVLEDSTIKLPALRDAQAKRHMGEGFNRRLLMVQSSRIRIREKTRPPRTESLSHYLATELCTHVNSYYVNLRGALDNMAWALIYEAVLKSPVNEDSRKTRQYCDLFGREFLGDLGRTKVDLATLIEGKREWGRNLKEFRDPAAHRIPLYIPPGVMREDDLKEFRRLNDLAAKSEAEREGRSRYEVLLEAQSLAQFEPILIASTVAGLRIYSLPGQLAYDHTTFLEVAVAVVQSL